MKSRKYKKPNLIELNFQRVKKLTNTLGDMINEPVIFIHKQQNFDYTYAAMIDDCVSRTLIVYDLHLLVRSHINPQEFEWLPMHESLPEFYLPEITMIYTPKDPGYGLDNAMASWLNHNIKPIRGIQCDWDGTSKTHSSHCNDDLHEAISFLYTKAIHAPGSHSDQEKLVQSLKYIINYLVVMGKAKIPTGYP